MTMLSANVKISGVSPLLQNNPQTVDRFNKFTQQMAQINKRGAHRTDDDYREMRDIEVRSKIYWDDGLQIYIPTTWMLAALAGASFSTVKISKAALRGSLFAAETKAKLHYRGMEKVAGPEDIVKNEQFRQLMNLKQGQVRVVKAVPVFHDWSFETGLEFDDKTIDPATLDRLIQHVARYGGFGDFRPTFGRAQAEVDFG